MRDGKSEYYLVNKKYIISEAQCKMTHGTCLYIFQFTDHSFLQLRKTLVFILNINSSSTFKIQHTVMTGGLIFTKVIVINILSLS